MTEWKMKNENNSHVKLAALTLQHVYFILTCLTLYRISLRAINDAPMLTRMENKTHN